MARQSAQQRPEPPNHDATERQAVPRITDAMIAFALRWLPFGGAPNEDILVQFGLDAAAYFERLLYAIGTGDPRIPVHTRARLHRQCRRRMRTPYEHVGI